MVYKKSKRNYRPRSKWNWARVGGTAVKSATKLAIAYNLATKLAKQNNAEYKFLDVGWAYTATDYNGLIYSLCTPAQGITDSTRVGDSIKCQHLELRAAVLDSGAASLVRCIVFEDKQNKVTAATDLLEFAGGQFAAFSPKQFDKKFQTKILHDQVVSVDPQNPFKSMILKVPLGHHTVFNAGTQTILTGAYKVLFISDRVAANVPVVQFSSRVLFTDN